MTPNETVFFQEIWIEELVVPIENLIVGLFLSEKFYWGHYSLLHEYVKTSLFH
jgi:hypothetical protein